jgi:hypothetical protein
VQLPTRLVDSPPPCESAASQYRVGLIRFESGCVLAFQGGVFGCSSRMTGNLQVRFLEAGRQQWRPATQQLAGTGVRGSLRRVSLARRRFVHKQLVLLQGFMPTRCEQFGDVKRQCEGNSSACYPCREFQQLPADALRSYCCLLLPRGISKSFVKSEKTGRGGGDRKQQ